jgi:superkiller protein 3
MTFLGLFNGLRGRAAADTAAAVSAAGCCELGAQLAAAGQLGKAIECFERAVQLDPDYAPAYVRLGAAYREAGRGVDAVKACHKALRLSPNDPEALVNLATVHYEWGSYQEALKACDKALRAAPDCPGAYYVRGLSYVDLGDRARALVEYKTLQGFDQEAADRLYMKIPKR